jgi:hypothetical protein
VHVKERNPFLRFSKSLTWLSNLQLIQKDIENLDIKKKQTKIWYLNQSYLLHLVALWEIFIEEQVFYAFKEMTKISPPGVFETLLETKMNEVVQYFHNPNVENINRIFKDVIGISNISSEWKWEKMSSNDSIALLKVILNTRHEIAHESQTKNDKLSFTKNFEYMYHLYNLAYLIDFSVSKHLAILAGEKFECQIIIPHPQE